MALTISGNPPPGVVGKAYATGFTVAGGTPPYQWSTVGGSLPAGLQLDPSTGQIRGRPASAGSSTFTLQLADSTKSAAHAGFSIVVTGPPPASPAGGSPSSGQSIPWFVPPVILVWLALLVASVPVYHDVHALQNNIPLQAGPVPLGVIWWGALGGVTVSLVGIAWHWTTWDPTYTWWHILRPLVGAIVGSVSYLIFITVIRSTGTTPSGTGVDSKVVFFLVAFITGYQEQTFRDLITRATQVLLGPGAETPDAGPTDGTSPSGADGNGSPAATGSGSRTDGAS